MAESVVNTHLGFFVITEFALVSNVLRYVETTLLVRSLSVIMPDNPPSLLINNAASARLLAIVSARSCKKTSSFINIGTFGLNFETGRTFSDTANFLGSVALVNVDFEIFEFRDKLSLETLTVSLSPLIFIASSKNPRQPLPPSPVALLTNSITSTTPTTRPDSSLTGR